ncbi:MAG: glycoside hydrolase family 16 protein [Prevotella sp.]|nr:glycoside hydrolase family 16 protein [Prevotella sp.]
MMWKSIFSVILLLGLTADTAGVRAQEQQWKLIFADEFNGKNGSAPNPDIWSTSPRGWSTWNRWISNSPKVAFIKKGKLVCRAIRNTENPADTAMMLTGAVETQKKFSFQYGKIEVRAKTKLHHGSFPAIWLMPEPPAKPNPVGGEIDIFESFGNYAEAHHTIHTNWTYNLKKTSPANQFVHKLNVGGWHVYGLEWSPTKLVFMIDGRVTGTYQKSTDPKALEQGQWPFDHPFYIILNQSLRRVGIFGGDPDPGYVYETQFDWVRVYQKQ